MDPILNLSIKTIILALMLIGAFGLVVPGFPGLTIIWVAALGYGIAGGFTLSTGLIFAGMTVMMLVGSIVDNVLMGAKAHEKGAGWLALGVGLVAGITGSILWPPLGGLLLAFVAVFVVELIRLRDWRQALQSTQGMATGCGWAVVIRFGIAILMIGLWVLWAFVLVK